MSIKSASCGSCSLFFKNFTDVSTFSTDSNANNQQSWHIRGSWDKLWVRRMNKKKSKDGQPLERQLLKRCITWAEWDQIAKGHRIVAYLTNRCFIRVSLCQSLLQCLTISLLRSAWVVINPLRKLIVWAFFFDRFGFPFVDAPFSLVVPDNSFGSRVMDFQVSWGSIDRFSMIDDHLDKLLSKLS